MEIRKKALALTLPLALGLAGCQTSRSSKTARAEGTTSTESSQGTAAGGGAVATAPGSSSTQGDTTYGGSGTATGRDDGTLTGELGAATGSDLKGHASDRVMAGTVSSVSSRSLSIASDTGVARTLQVVPETIITVEGRDGRIDDLKEGEQVRASFNEQDGRQVAVKIEAGATAGMGTTVPGPGPEATTPGAPTDPSAGAPPSDTAHPDTSGTR